MRSHTRVGLKVSSDGGKTWRDIQVIGDVQIEYGLPVRRKPRKRKRAQQVRRRLRLNPEATP